MIRLSLAAVRKAAATRPAGYLDAVLAAASSVNGDVVTLSGPAYRDLRGRYRRGLGDLVAAGLSAAGITEDRVSRILGRPCNCKHRVAALNRIGDALVSAVTPRPDQKRG